MSTRSKGKTLERRAEAWFISKGCLTWRPHPGVIFIGPGRWISQSQDIFGAFDLIAYGRRFYLIQVTTVDSSYALPSHKKRKVESIDISPDDACLCVMAWEKRKGWTFWVMKSDRSWERLDEHEFVSKIMVRR